MTPDPSFHIGKTIYRTLRVVGNLKFIKRLHDFLMHEGRLSRTDVLKKTAEVVVEMEKAEALRIANTKMILDMMRDAGFPEADIQAELSNPKEVHRVSTALATMLMYVEKGVVELDVVDIPDRGNERPAIGQKTRNLPSLNGRQVRELVAGNMQPLMPVRKCSEKHISDDEPLAPPPSVLFQKSPAKHISDDEPPAPRE